MVGRRLREYRKSKGIFGKDLAKRIGISAGSFSDIENEKTKPSSDTIASIIRQTDINPVWLMTGDGPMLRGEIKDDVDDVTKMVVEHMRDMDDDARRDVLKHLQEKKLIAELLKERGKRRAS